MKKLITVLVIIALLLVVFLLLGPFYILSEGEQAVVTRFGKIVDTQTESGLKFKMPLVDNVVKYSSKLQIWDGEAQRIPTSENQFIWVDATARWYIADPALFYETVGTVSSGLGRLNDIIDSTIRTVISENNLNEAVRSTNRINSMEYSEEINNDLENQEDAETLRSLTNTRQRQEEINTIEDASRDTSLFGVVLKKSDSSSRSLRDRIEEQNRMVPYTYEYGTLARVKRFVRLPNKSIHVFVETLEVIHIDQMYTDT